MENEDLRNLRMLLLEFLDDHPELHRGYIQAQDIFDVLHEELDGIVLP